MGKRGNPKHIGTCGIYVIVERCGSTQLLVHRRSKQVSEPYTIASPGGIVERKFSTRDGGHTIDFDFGARNCAVKELDEETGVRLTGGDVDALIPLPVGEGCYWGPEYHRNYAAVLHDVPNVTGPEKDSVHELIPQGMNGIGKPAGDGYHAWVDIRDLLARTDLMRGCRVPVSAYLELYVHTPVRAVSPVAAALRPPAWSSVASLSCSRFPTPEQAIVARAPATFATTPPSWSSGAAAGAPLHASVFRPTCSSTVAGSFRRLLPDDADADDMPVAKRARGSIGRVLEAARAVSYS